MVFRRYASAYDSHGLFMDDILIADELTTAFDVTIQAQILELMKSLQKELGMVIL